MNGTIEYEDNPQVRKSRSKLDASSPQPINKSAGKPGGNPPEVDHTLKTIEIMEDLGSIDINASNLDGNHRRRPAI